MTCPQKYSNEPFKYLRSPLLFPVADQRQLLIKLTEFLYDTRIVGGTSQGLEYSELK